MPDYRFAATAEEVTLRELGVSDSGRMCGLELILEVAGYYGDDGDRWTPPTAPYLEIVGVERMQVIDDEDITPAEVRAIEQLSPASLTDWAIEWAERVGLDLAELAAAEDLARREEHDDWRARVARDERRHT